MTTDIKLEIEKCKTQIMDIFKKQKTYCDYSGCLVQYCEHYHIDQHTLTFLKPEEKMPAPYPENVKKIATEILAIIEKYYPDLIKRNYDSMGYPRLDGNLAQERIEVCVYIELMKAGAFNDQLSVEKAK